ncbi:receptor-type tyrosine-protein phosphatase kappa-like [Liolophura sinensis]|uniref:receptor-type tyrosine-protein phosphatase kappa-like n=1 Tax=Liolophura sinensis TaxID=3198878 RepID=UPI003158947D
MADQGSSAGKIAGGIVGALLLVAVVVVVVILYRRRSSSASSDRPLGLSRNQADRPENHAIGMENRGLHADNVPVQMNEADEALPYENLFTTVVSADEFWEYYHRKKASDGFSAEYAKFPAGLQAKHDVADLPCNKIKSRYKNLVACEHFLFCRS